MAFDFVAAVDVFTAVAEAGSLTKAKNCVQRELDSGALVRVMADAHTMSPPLWIAYPTCSARQGAP